jgi:hypothetical protein
MRCRQTSDPRGVEPMVRSLPVGPLAHSLVCHPFPTFMACRWCGVVRLVLVCGVGCWCLCWCVGGLKLQDDIFAAKKRERCSVHQSSLSDRVRCQAEFVVTQMLFPGGGADRRTSAEHGPVVGGASICVVRALSQAVASKGCHWESSVGEPAVWLARSLETKGQLLGWVLNSGGRA